MNILKLILITLGTLSLCIGVIGIFVPGLPTTPFLLLTAGLYVKSSRRLYAKLINHRIIGSVILEYNERRGMTKRAKIYALGTMWMMITVTSFLFIKPLLIQFLILTLGAVGTFVMIFIVPTANK